MLQRAQAGDQTETLIVEGQVLTIRQTESLSPLLSTVLDGSG